MTSDTPPGADGPKPYRSTPVFDEQTLPAGLRNRHDTKDGVWGLIRVLEGQLRLTMIDPPGEQILEPGRPGIVRPSEAHFVTPLGPLKMQVDFYRESPLV